MSTHALVQNERDAPTFEEFAAQWFERQTVEGGHAGTGLAPKSRADLEWRLDGHLLPAFASQRVDEISIQDVDAYRVGKVHDGELAPSSINKTIATLSTILEVAVEYEIIDRNPAHGRRRRLRASTPKRSWLDRAAHIAALLDGAACSIRRRGRPADSAGLCWPRWSSAA